MTIYHPKLVEVVRRDGRYAYEAYEFVYAALNYTQRTLRREPPESADPEDTSYHLTGRELLLGIRDFALREYGLMARTVFQMWGIERTADFGEMVFNLIDANLMSKSSRDTREDFHDVYDFVEELERNYRITLEEAG